MSEPIQFDSKIRKRGGSYYMLIPPTLRKHLKLKDNKNVKMQVEEGKYGPYLSAWNPDQQEKTNEG